MADDNSEHETESGLNKLPPLYVHILDADRDRLIFDLINQRQSQEFGVYSNLDNKASSIASSVGVILGFLIGFRGINGIGGLNWYVITLFGISVGALFLAFMFAIVALRIRKLELVPNTKKLIEKYEFAPMEKVMSIVGGEMRSVIEELQVRNASKANLIKLAWILMASGLFVMLLYVLALF